jgi:hypothetical protein
MELIQLFLPSHQMVVVALVMAMD